MMQTCKTGSTLIFSLLAVIVTACTNESKNDVAEQPSVAPYERPAWTPDGKSIVFGGQLDGNRDIFIMDKDGDAYVNLTNSPIDEMFPSVSSSGDKIAYVGKVDGNYDIYVMDIDGEKQTRLTENDRIDDWPSWRNRDQKIVYDYVDDGNYGFMRMHADGSGKELIFDDDVKTVDPMTVDTSEFIVYSSDRPDPGGNRQIYLLSLDTGKTQQLTNNDLTNAHPSLSSDESVVFNAGTDYWNIFTMKVDGSDVRQLTDGNYDSKWGAWSPDGKEIAFMSNKTGAWQIYIMNADGGNIRQITDVN